MKERNPAEQSGASSETIMKVYEAARWIEEELVRDGFSKEVADAEGRSAKNLMLHLVIAGENRGLVPMELARNKLSSIRKRLKEEKNDK